MALAVREERDESIVARHFPVGASTGYMDSLRGDWHAQVGEASAVSVFAVELSALSERELRPLRAYLESAGSLPFRYISIHGPSKDREMDEVHLVEELKRLGEWSDAIVLHPDTIEDPAIYRSLGRLLLIENMDSRKDSGRTREELEPIFEELPDAGFCFDVAHAWSIDPGMTVAAELLNAFAARLRHVHVSSLSDELHHIPLTKEDERRFSPVLARCMDVPWILEAPPRNE
jgi:hypothetical protein